VKIKDNTRIADNARARFDYSIEDTYQAGIVLQGWEIKSIRAGRVQIAQAHVVIRNGEVFLVGCQIVPLETASSHVSCDATRTRKLLLKRDQIRRMIGKIAERGYTAVPLNMHWHRGRVKVELALAKGKTTHDKRACIKERDVRREIEQTMKARLK
jgi:SsrA-binding protein